MILRLFKHVFHMLVRADISQVLEGPDSKFRFVATLSAIVGQSIELVSICVSGKRWSAPVTSTTMMFASRLVIERTVCKLVLVLPKIHEMHRPQGYLELLWYLFKSKIHCQDLDGLMQPALELFLSMLDGPDVGVRRDLIVELCLLLPLELEKKYPILPKLMKPLVMALKASSQLRTTALRKV